MVENNEFLFGLAGSTTLVQYKDHFLALITKHQTKEREPSLLCLPSVKPKKFTSPNRIMWALNLEGWDGDRSDFAVLDYTEPVTMGSIDRNLFFELNPSTSLEDSDPVVAYLAYGYAYIEQDFVVQDDPEKEPGLKSAHLKKRVFVCEEDGSSHDEDLLRLGIKTRDTFESNGFSGGTVFAIVQGLDGFTVKFAGTIVRGGSGAILHALRPPVVMHWLREMIGE